MFPLLTLDVQPIPPSQIVDAVNRTGESAINIGRGISDPITAYLFVAAGFAIVFGLVLNALGLTKRLLAAGLFMIMGAVVMLVLTHHPVEIVGLIKGVAASFFGNLRGAGS